VQQRRIVADGEIGVAGRAGEMAPDQVEFGRHREAGQRREVRRRMSGGRLA
jgi:hypothetical protein